MKRAATRSHASSRRAPDPWHALRVISRLEVGPVELFPRSLVAPYRIRLPNGRSSSFDLTYRYQEDVFDTSDAECRNLADMIAVQVALNYGLFCDEIVFHGAHDAADQRFITTMMENTAREISVKKFLEPNPFLVGAGVGLPAERRDAYSQARLEFANQVRGAGTPWSRDARRVAVLSSGGKDSLLSFGLLRELEQDVHPVFINESGRHWLTALNAFRSLSATHPHTTRVWTNSDRAFAWFLRHMSFVRQDFQRLRSDEYPVRLWTVAVFLFGALPVLRHRGVGRLVIGDEYDTSRRETHAGIPHYDGLYDQSRWFDLALSRYFLSKGWNVRQFSILRPLSEILVQKTLVERYPDLAAHQVSCHAAHVEGSRIRPCGRCEKCRRIVGMLLSQDVDPALCGYDEAQSRHCMEQIAQQGVHQESDAARHLAHMLVSRGRLDAPGATFAPAARPHVMKLRFDRRRSPVTDVPRDLRHPLYALLVSHADGCVRRLGRAWIDFDLWSDPALDRPDPLDKKGGESMSNNGAPTRYLLAELTWPEARERLREVDVALLPVGSIEQHGPHLPLDTDAFDADYLAREVAAACADPKPLVLPLLPYGVSYHHEDFAGTISVSPDTLSRLVYDVGMSAARHGITKLVIVNGHGGNAPSLHFAAQMINRDAHVFTCVDTGETSDHDIEALSNTPNDVHAGEIETSTTLAVRPHLVRLAKARKLVPKFSSQYLDFTSRRSVTWYARTKRISRNGVMGDPTVASREKGEEMWRVMIRNLTELVEHLKTLSLDEIYQTRY